MKELYDLKEMLLVELEEYGKKGELTAGTLEIVDKLAHATKNLDKVIMCLEGGEEQSFRGSYDEGGSYRGGSYRMSRNSYEGEGGGSYRGRGSGAKRYENGRYAPYSRRGYSRADDMAGKLREMAEQAPDDKTRQEIQRLADKMEQG